MWCGAANFGPYHAAAIEALECAGWKVSIIGLRLREPVRPWKPDFGGVKPVVVESWRTAVGVALASRPDVALLNGYTWQYIRLAVALRKQGIATVLGLTSWRAHGGGPGRKLKEFLKTMGIRWAFDCVFAAGSRSRDYALQLGFPSERIATGFAAVDNSHFDRGIVGKRPLGVCRRHFLYVGRFSAEKNLPGLLAAFARYRANGGTWGLRMVGAGPSLRGIKERLKSANDHFGVTLSGWVSYQELPRVYGSSSVFVLPSVRETWGRVVNEAMASGLPCVVSDACGCCPDLVVPGQTGFRVRAGSVIDLADTLRTCEDLAGAHLSRMGRSARLRVSRFDVSNVPDRLEELVEQVDACD